jgi:hypothetical protein
VKKVAAVLLTAGTMVGCASAPPPAHPRYLHARSDLRSAQWFLGQGSEEPNVARRLHQADVEVGAAIREIDHAAFLDAKNLDVHPHEDANLDRPGRFRKVIALLRSARSDISMEEDNPAAAGWRDVAYRHIDAALDHVHRAAVDLRIDQELGF